MIEYPCADCPHFDMDCAWQFCEWYVPYFKEAWSETVRPLRELAESENIGRASGKVDWTDTSVRSGWSSAAEVTIWRSNQDESEEMDL